MEAKFGTISLLDLLSLQLVGAADSDTLNTVRARLLHRHVWKLRIGIENIQVLELEIGGLRMLTA